MLKSHQLHPAALLMVIFFTRPPVFQYIYYPKDYNPFIINSGVEPEFIADREKLAYEMDDEFPYRGLHPFFISWQNWTHPEIKSCLAMLHLSTTIF
jgi:hypothetical protein